MRTLALVAVLLSALVAPLVLAAPAAAAPKPVKLRLISLVCRQTNDIASADEAKLQIDGVDVFGPVQIANNESRDLGSVPATKFRRTITVTLIDEDVVGADDNLGTVNIRRDAVGQGVQELTFEENGPDYSLFFKVVA